MKYIIEKESAKKLQELAREEMKHKLLADILMDMEICKLEWRDVLEYSNSIKQMIDSILPNN